MLVEFVVHARCVTDDGHSSVGRRGYLVGTGASVLIDRPIREVFDYAVNPQYWPAWMPAASGVSWIARGSLEVGATFVQKGSLADSGAEITWEVTQYEPPRVLACRRISDPRITIRQVFESVGGGTRLTIQIDDDARTFGAGSTAGQTLAGCLVDGLNRLRSLLAGETTPRPATE